MSIATSIEGKEAELGAAVARAAEILKRARFPLVTGLRADVGGIRGALRLARATGGAVDHGHSGAIYPFLSALRDSGMMLAAPAEMRRRADCYLVVGPDAFAGDAGLIDFLMKSAPDLGAETGGIRQTIVWIEPPGTLPALPEGIEVVSLASAGGEVSDVLAILRARHSGRRHGTGSLDPAALETALGVLRGAHFGCAIFAPAALDAITIEMLAGLVFDLNDERRFSCLPVMPGDQAMGAALLATADGGFPLRMSYSPAPEPARQAVVEHDPFVLDGARLIAAGEVDCVVVVDGLESEPLGVSLPNTDAPLIVLSSGEFEADTAPAVAFTVSAAGRGAPGAVYEGRFTGFVPAEAPEQGTREHPTAGEILEWILAALVANEAPNEAVA